MNWGSVQTFWVLSSTWRTWVMASKPSLSTSWVEYGWHLKSLASVESSTCWRKACM
ncbi:hypothetical protein INR49_014768 [Caranx melampygus]|nr:hypothetical protein INR49_014768 [Caranx melampygus]